MRDYNIYCDESSVDGDKLHRYFVIGALIFPRIYKNAYLKKINLSRKEHVIKEIKWSKLSQSSFKLSKSFVDFLLTSPDVAFYAIVVDKTKINYEFYHEGSKELAFYKFYYTLLKNKIRSGNRYYIYLDKKPVAVQNRVGVLKNFLTGFIKSFRQDCVIKHLQEYPSEENIFIQISDIFTGAVASSFNFQNKGKSSPKLQLIKYIETKIRRKLNTKTAYTENKFNVFVWNPKNK